MEPSSQFLLTLGAILLLGLLTSIFAKKKLIPRVTLLLAAGILIGDSGLGLIPKNFNYHFQLIADMTLLMVGFLLGGKLTKKSLLQNGLSVFIISLFEACLTVCFVAAGLWLIGLSLQLSLILGCIASASAPAAVIDVVDEVGVDNKFTRKLLSIVALDDVWALILFCIGLAIVSALNGGGNTSFILVGFREVGGAVFLGIILGLAGAYFTGRLKEGRPILVEALGLVFICGGLALYFEVSYLIASMVMGMTITNFASHHEYPFHAIEDIEWPFMLIFFILAGASLEVGALKTINLIGVIYIISRCAGKYLGTKAGAHISKSDQITQNWMGAALLPQAGVAIGMALVASKYFPDDKQLLFSLVIASTVVFELIGPVLTKVSINKST